MNAPYVKLSEINKHLPEMKRRGVSRVARSQRGFLSAYKRADGSPKKLSAQWRRRREGFIKRHMAQVVKRNEKLVKNGKHSRRWLALMAWAYRPKSNPSKLTVQQRTRARKADLGILPPKLCGTSCGSCKFFSNGYCHHKAVDQPVGAHWCCNYWDAPGFRRIAK